MKHNTYILKCFLQFACTNLDGSQKEGGNFLNFHQKEGVTQKGEGGERVPSEKGGSNPGVNYAGQVLLVPKPKRLFYSSSFSESFILYFLI